MKGITWTSTSISSERRYGEEYVTLRADGVITGQIPYMHLGYLRGDIECLLNGADTTSKPRIQKVIFNNPATIILWTDGTKTVVKCQPGDIYDKEKGFAMAYLKKLLGNDNTFNKEINKWVDEENAWDMVTKKHIVEDIEAARAYYKMLMSPVKSVASEDLGSVTYGGGCDICNKYADTITRHYANSGGHKLHYTHCPFCGKKLKKEESK